jgi:hypothetical protein
MNWITQNKVVNEMLLSKSYTKNAHSKTEVGYQTGLAEELQLIIYLQGENLIN